MTTGVISDLRKAKLCVLLALPFVLLAQNAKADANDILNESRSIGVTPSRRLVCQLLTESYAKAIFDETSLKNKRECAKEEIDAIKFLDDCFIVAVLVTNKVSGYQQLPSGDEFSKIIKVYLNNKELKILDLKSSPPGAQAFIREITPMFASSFNDKNAAIIFITVPKKENQIFTPIEWQVGELAVAIQDVKMKHKLPIVSTLPPRIDPETKEKFPGTYNFNPYTGKKLQ